MQTDLIRPVRVGNVRLKNNLALAPMAGITNAAFRILAAGGGAGLVVTEMVSAESIKYGNKKSGKMLELLEGEHPAAVQLFGADPSSMALAAQAAERAGADIADVNAGCPVRKVIRSGAGAGLMSKPQLLADIISRMVKSVKIPVTVKFRVGLAAGENLGPLLARVCEEAGAAAITLHGRPAPQLHTGPVDLAAMAATVAAVKIPVFGNGGVGNPQQAREMLGTGCAGVAIGRAAVFNPAVFAEIASGLSGGSLPPVSCAARMKLFLKFLELNAGLYGEEHGLVRARKLAGYWLKGLPGASGARGAFMKLKTLKEAEALLIQYYK
ncbi:MAG: tRNA dihydrouridine synthase DusB [Elusimicrobia bacterium CG08_land_8_20_14_0_20_59_10]|nr:MAG: tRNA dihydrouridine synthase DusB [Elusimicrobia bacterium CG08_land_8_20_14_0_20_59_10]